MKLNSTTENSSSHDPLDELPIQSAVPWRTYLTRSLRFKFFASGFLFPLVCLIVIATTAGASFSATAPWQSGRLQDYITVLIRPPGIFWFYPFLFYSMCCLVLWCINPIRFSNSQPIRLGLFSGVFLAFAFMVLLSIVTAFVGQVMALFVMTGLAAVTWLLTRIAGKLIRFSILNLMVLTTIVALLLTIGMSRGLNSDDAARSVSIVLLFVCGAAPTTALVAFVRVSVAAFAISTKDSGSRFLRLGLWIGWMLSGATSTRFAVETMLDEYSRLPTTNPNCYICSAAAYGHRALVGSSKNEHGGWVNLQMKRCKFLELVLLAICPGLAVALRQLYDVAGPALARACRINPFFADLTYLLLKPIEMTALVIQKRLSIGHQRIQQLYE